MKTIIIIDAAFGLSIIDVFVLERNVIYWSFYDWIWQSKYSMCWFALVLTFFSHVLVYLIIKSQVTDCK